MVEIYSWNPARAIVRGPLGRVLKRHVNNFGDLLGPIVVQAMLSKVGVASNAATNSTVRLFTVGSVLHFASDGDVVWGTGVNGKIAEDQHVFRYLDVRAVRGPLTRDFLAARGISAPEIFGDPALLLPDLMPELRQWAADPMYDVTVVPNLNDYPTASFEALNPRAPVRECLQRIARSRFVVGSSLHALVVAESLGIPARGVRSMRESEFKYADYYLSTGRPSYHLATSYEEALAMGGEPPIDWRPKPLADSFPWDLWGVTAGPSLT